MLHIETDISPLVRPQQNGPILLSNDRSFTALERRDGITHVIGLSPYVTDTISASVLLEVLEALPDRLVR